MAYFANGTEGLMYQEEYCFKCVNLIDKADGRGPGCPVWDLHLFFNYNTDDEVEAILNYLIPMGKDDLNNQQCIWYGKELGLDADSDPIFIMCLEEWKAHAEKHMVDEDIGQTFLPFVEG